MRFRNPLSSWLATSALAVAAVTVPALTMHAQQAVAPAQGSFLLSSAASSSLPDFRYHGADVSSSSDDGVSASAAPATAEDERANLASDASQPPPRRRTYGRARYSDKWHNADGSSKIAFEAGAGFAEPTGSTSNYQTIGWKFSVGAGINFNKKFGILGQFDYDRMNVPSSILNAMSANYENLGIDPSGLDANTHVWSISVNPVYSFLTGEKAGAYVVGGLGYARKTTNFTLPSTGTYCDYYFGCYPITTNQTFDQYTNGGLLLNAGLGFTYKVSRFGNEKLFAEARYQWVNNSPDNSSFYPPNSYRTGYFPVTVGVRW